MSADNYYVVRKHPKGGYTYVTGFLSDDDPDLSVRSKHPRYDSALEAYREASRGYSEYGVRFHEEIKDEEI